MGWGGWLRESEGCSWGEADGMGARDDGGGCVGLRGRGAARLLGLGGCWGRALCIAVGGDEDKRLNDFTPVKTSGGDRLPTWGGDDGMLV